MKDLMKMSFEQVYNVRIKPSSNKPVKKPLKKQVKVVKTRKATK